MAESDAFRLGMELSGAIYDVFLHHYEIRRMEFGGEQFELEDSEVGDPFLLRRVSDGALFEVDLGADVVQVTPEVEDRRREMAAAARAYLEAPGSPSFWETPSAGETRG